MTTPRQPGDVATDSDPTQCRLCLYPLGLLDGLYCRDCQELVSAQRRRRKTENDMRDALARYDELKP